MSEFETVDGRLDSLKLDMALLELEAGTLEALRRDELMALVNRSPAAQRAYLRYFEMSALLGTEAATHAEHGNLPKIVNFEPPLRLFRRAVLAAAALVTLGAVVAALVHVARPQVAELTVTAAADTRWSVLDDDRGAGGNQATVREGSSVRVESGTLELRLKSGASMVMQGPTHLSFPKLSQPVLRSGWLWIDSGPSQERFEVLTPELRIRNLGTRFGVRVEAGEPAEVHLINGSLAVAVGDPRKKELKLVPEGNGLAISALGEPSPLRLARDPFREIAGLLAAPANYPTTVLGQNPAGYWRLDGGSEGRLHNEVEGESAGRMQSDVSKVTGGPGPAEGFEGFDATNQAVRLTGRPAASLLSLGAVARHEGLLIQETFDGTGPLDQSRPEVAMGEADWTAAPHFLADGSIAAGYGSATLPFRPVDGMVYLLDAALRDVTVPAGVTDWVGLGFANGQSIGTGTDDRFVNGKVAGRAWMLFRGYGAELGSTTLLAGNSDSEIWRNWSIGSDDAIDMRVVLDTTGGSGNWTATWFARRPGDRDFVKVRDTSRLPNEAIRSVGIAVTGKDIRARIAGFSLRAEAVAEPLAAPIRADGPSRIHLRSGAVSCWLRREPGSGLAAILWSAGEDRADDSIHARIEADGRVGVFIENGRYDVLLTSEKTLTDGQWHHLAASWSPNTVDLYLDGNRVAWEREGRGLLEGALPDLRVGGRPQDHDPAPFAGDIDEFAIWDRALTLIEIEQQYRSAKGAVE
jgi:ferric-dicitrate binding protein FerR (iron transport regulator)